jgi:hypothetical protein
MLLAGLVTLTLALGHLAQVLGADEQIGGDLVWIGPVVAVLAAAIAVFFRAPAAALVAALATAAGVFAFVAVVVEPDDEETYRWVATGLIAGFLAAGLVLRALGDGRHSVQLVNAAGLMVIALSYALGVFLLVDFDDGYGLERGWEAVLVLGSLAVTACAVLFRERGTGWIGAVGLAAAIFSVAGESDETPAFVGWPLFLTVGAAVLFLAALLRPAARR